MSVLICAYSTRVFVETLFSFYHEIASHSFSIHKGGTVACLQLFLLENTGNRKAKMLRTPFNMMMTEDNSCSIQTSDQIVLDGYLVFATVRTKGKLCFHD